LKTIKIKLLISGVVLATLTLLSLTSFTTYNQLNIDESINTLEDMREWLIDDINNEYVESERGALYIENIDNVLERLHTEKNYSK